VSRLCLALGLCRRPALVLVNDFAVHHNVAPGQRTESLQFSVVFICVSTAASGMQMRLEHA